MVAVYILAGVLGLCVGSFLNVVIYRVPNGMSLAKPPSHCPQCGTRIKWYDNIPVLSYCFLGGKCRSCGAHIPFRYTLVELANALLWLACVFAFWERSIPYACIAAVACSVFLCVACIDLEHMLVFDRFVVILAALGVASIFFDGFAPWWSHLVGGGGGGLVLLLIGLVLTKLLKKDALGGGDVKLVAAFGLLLGWEKLLLGLLVASLTASVALLVLRLVRKDERGREYPFAPFLVFGAAVAMFVGELVIEWYLSLFIA